MFPAWHRAGSSRQYSNSRAARCAGGPANSCVLRPVKRLRHPFQLLLPASRGNCWCSPLALSAAPALRSAERRHGAVCPWLPVPAMRRARRGEPRQPAGAGNRPPADSRAADLRPVRQLLDVIDHPVSGSSIKRLHRCTAAASACSSRCPPQVCRIRISCLHYRKYFVRTAQPASVWHRDRGRRCS